MGICLDTEQSDGSQAFEEGRETWGQNSARNPRNAVTPIEGRFPMHNAANLHFESPKVPVIFVLGGPGSGKVTHCDNLMQEKYGIIHVNMTDLLQQYAVGNDMQDFSQLSSKTVTEVLMLEMKMAPTAKTYLVSGYPRNMRDVVEYSEKIQIINGVILIQWRQKMLEKQIEYGAKLGHIVLSLARMEFNNFYKHVMPVAEYFDQNNMLISINGERPPDDVYKEFRSAIMRILGMQDNPPVFSSGPAPGVPNDVTNEHSTAQTLPGAAKLKNSVAMVPQPVRPQTQVLSVNGNLAAVKPYPRPRIKDFYPPVLWVIGGPGSNKAILCEQASKETGWIHIGTGKLFRAVADSTDKRPGSDSATIRECIANGDMVPNDTVMKTVESHVAANVEAEGIILDGFPRDLNQATEFEAKFKQKPTVILLDCSKLELGRGRLDDTVAAFRRRLEIFRQSSLPMLKAMDNIGRLTIVDGDTATQQVQNDFKAVIKEHVAYQNERAQHQNNVANGNVIQNGASLANGNAIVNGHVGNGHISRVDDTVVHDLEAEPIETISKGFSHNPTNGVNTVLNGHGIRAIKVPGIGNGYLKSKIADLNADRQENIRQLYGNAENHI